MRRRLGIVAACLILLGIIVTAVVVTAPRSVGTGQTASPTARAEAAMGAMESLFFHPVLGAAADRVPAQGWAPFALARHGASVWSYSWSLAGIEDVASLPGGSRYLGLVESETNDLQRYWDGAAPVPAYAPGWFPGASATKYYDDNAWVGLDLVLAFHLTGKIVYLRRAEAVMRYEETGWDASGGGIYWNDQHLSRNTCSNAPVAELAAYLYRVTNDPSYLAWAERIYAWESQTLVDPSNGSVWDHIDPSGKINRALWTYNQGTVIGAGVLLYKLTGNTADLAQAEKTAQFVLTHMVNANGVLVAQPQFNGVLVDNLQLLDQVTHNTAITQLIEANAHVAWTRAQTPAGLFAKDWGGPAPTSGTVSLLTQGGAVRLLAVAASLQTGGFQGLWL